MEIFKWSLDINKVVRTLIIVDFFFNSAFGIFAPVFAIFITRQIQGGSATVVGLAVSVYWIVKSIIQLPVARFLDKTDGERDDFWALFFGYLFASLVPFSYILVTRPWQLYLVEGFLGFCMAWAVPAWYGIFTRHVDKWRISFEWSVQSVFSVGVAISIVSALSGYISDHYGFNVLFVIAGTLSFIAAFLLLLIRKEMRPLNHQERILPEHAKPHA